MKRLLGLLISGALVAGSVGAALAQETNPQDTTSGAKQGTTSGAKQGTKNAGGGTNTGTSTVKKTKKTTKKTVNKGSTEAGKATGTKGEKAPTK
jgi:hypothetical protein